LTIFTSSNVEGYGESAALPYDINVVIYPIVSFGVELPGTGITVAGF
jgi:hypothetical protein